MSSSKNQMHIDVLSPIKSPLATPGRPTFPLSLPPSLIWRASNKSNILNDVLQVNMKQELLSVDEIVQMSSRKKLNFNIEEENKDLNDFIDLGDSEPGCTLKNTLYISSDFANRKEIIDAFEKVMTQNDIIINDCKVEKSLIYPEYFLKTKDQSLFPTFEVSESFLINSLTERLKLYSVAKEPAFLNDTQDYFNFKNSFQAKIFSDLVIISQKLKTELAAFCLVEDNKKLRDSLLILLNNAQILNWHLQAAKRFVSNTSSNLGKLHALVHTINSSLLKLKEFGVKEVELIPKELKHFNIDNQHIRSLTSWIEERIGSRAKNFKLLYHTKQDSFSTANFHSQCDNKKNLLVFSIVKDKYVFGAFTVQPFSSEDHSENYIEDKDAFLFSLISPVSIESKIFKCKNPKKALFYKSSYGPTYGFGYDLNIGKDYKLDSSSSYMGFPDTYEDSIGKGYTSFLGSRYFQISDLIVYQVGDK